MIRNGLLFVVAFFMSGAALSAENAPVKVVKKTYVQLDKVFIDEEGIFVDSPSGVIAVHALLYDDGGHYYKEKGSWSCPSCGRLNGPNDAICPNSDCHWPN